MKKVGMLCIIQSPKFPNEVIEFFKEFIVVHKLSFPDVVINLFSGFVVNTNFPIGKQMFALKKRNGQSL
jgi:hypothetical protein